MLDRNALVLLRHNHSPSHTLDRCSFRSAADPSVGLSQPSPVPSQCAARGNVGTVPVVICHLTDYSFPRIPACCTVLYYYRQVLSPYLYDQHKSAKRAEVRRKSFSGNALRCSCRSCVTGALLYLVGQGHRKQVPPGMVDARQFALASR